MGSLFALIQTLDFTIIFFIHKNWITWSLLWDSEIELCFRLLLETSVNLCRLDKIYRPCVLQRRYIFYSTSLFWLINFSVPASVHCTDLSIFHMTLTSVHCTDLSIFHMTLISVHRTVKVQSKAIPLQAWTGPEGFRRLRLPDFKTIGTWRW
jgi:hypothetical protein